ncbi:MAG: DUF1697 domain-containing protein [Chitinophagaceae bacterium]|nr:MAG: DUF1697 domain-containing protein [Chitinophagaceae bacterium]
MQYIILLRGINVGGRTIKMDELKKSFEKAGYADVVTVLQTGNIILDSKEKNINKVHGAIESLLTKTFNYPAKVLVITPEQLRTVIEQYPFTNYGPEYHRYVIFTEKGFEKEMAKQENELDKSIEEIKAGNDVLYWRVLKGKTLDSTFGKYMAKAGTKHFLTNRNVNTLEKILTKCV